MAIFRSEDDTNRAIDPGAAVDGAAGVFALAAIVASSASDYVHDLRTSIGRLFGGDGLEAALREERGRTKATVLALAVIADGAITDAERPVIADFAKRHGLDPADVDAKLAALAASLRDPRVLEEKVTQCASSLTANERLEVFVAVKNLAHRGSRAWPGQAGYRSAPGPTPEALVAVFRDALRITPTPGSR